eukprot:PhF_6_TR31540/c0_g1_i2/m.46530
MVSQTVALTKSESSAKRYVSALEHEVHSLRMEQWQQQYEYIRLNEKKRRRAIMERCWYEMSEIMISWRNFRQVITAVMVPSPSSQITNYNDTFREAVFAAKQTMSEQVLQMVGVLRKEIEDGFGKIHNIPIPIPKRTALLTSTRAKTLYSSSSSQSKNNHNAAIQTDVEIKQQPPPQLPAPLPRVVSLKSGSPLHLFSMSPSIHTITPNKVMTKDESINTVSLSVSHHSMQTIPTHKPTVTSQSQTIPPTVGMTTTVLRHLNNIAIEETKPVRAVPLPEPLNSALVFTPASAGVTPIQSVVCTPALVQQPAAAPLPLSKPQDLNESILSEATTTSASSSEEEDVKRKPNHVKKVPTAATKRKVTATPSELPLLRIPTSNPQIKSDSDTTSSASDSAVINQSSVLSNAGNHNPLLGATATPASITPTALPTGASASTNTDTNTDTDDDEPPPPSRVTNTITNKQSSSNATPALTPTYGVAAPTPSSYQTSRRSSFDEDDAPHTVVAKKKQLSPSILATASNNNNSAGGRGATTVSPVTTSAKTTTASGGGSGKLGALFGSLDAVLAVNKLKSTASTSNTSSPALGGMKRQPAIYNDFDD